VQGGAVKGTLENPPIIIEGRRIRAIVVFSFSLFLLLVTALEVTVKALSTIAIEGALLWTAAVLVTGWQVARPSRLEVTSDGITLKVLWRTRRYAWDQIHDFRPCTVGLYTQTVGFDFVSPPAKGRRMRQINAGLAGVHGTLSVGWTLKPHDLADLLNDARERWLRVDVHRDDVVPAARRIAPPRAAPGYVGARMRRIPFTIVTALIFALNAVLVLASGQAGGARYAFVGLTIYFTARRLHDMGRSGWWQLAVHVTAFMAAIGLTIATSPKSSAPAMSAVGAIEVVFFVFLCLIRGDRGSNRFGPAPGQRSALATSESFR